MNEILKYIDHLEDTLKAYKEAFNMLFRELVELNDRLEVIEEKLDIVPFPEVDDDFITDIDSIDPGI